MLVCLYPCHTLLNSVLSVHYCHTLAVLCTLYIIVIPLLYSASLVVWSRDAGFTECIRFRYSKSQGNIPAVFRIVERNGEGGTHSGKVLKAITGTSLGGSGR